jgi:hypothetical protein
MPISISKPTSTAEKPDLHYISFDEAVTQFFTNEHQPSLQSKRRNKNIVGEVTIGARESMSTELDQIKLRKGSTSVEWLHAMIVI